MKKIHEAKLHPEEKGWFHKYLDQWNKESDDQKKVNKVVAARKKLDSVRSEITDDEYKKEIEEFNFEWTHSLRNIYTKEKEFICRDDCESLGRWPVWVKQDQHLVDSSSYCFTNKFLRMVGHIWDHGWGADRRFYMILKNDMNHRNYGCSGKYTMNYRLGGNEGSVTPEFFTKGNEIMSQRYNNKYPWSTEIK